MNSKTTALVTAGLRPVESKPTNLKPVPFEGNLNGTTGISQKAGRLCSGRIRK